jgi:hypothetical protein
MSNELDPMIPVLRAKVEILEKNGHDETARILRRVIAELIDCGAKEN